MAVLLKARFRNDLRELRADLESVERGMGRLVGEVGKRELAPLVAEVQGLMPFDSTHRGWKSHDENWNAKEDPGHIRESVSGVSSANRFSVVTTHPGGPVHWWGGQIRPHGGEITIRPEAGAGENFVSKVEADVVDAIDDALDQLLRRHRL